MQLPPQRGDPTVLPEAWGPHNPTRPRAPAPTRPGFGSGLGALFGGVGFVVSTPSSWPVASVPILIGIALAGVASWASIKWVPPFVDGLIGPTESGLAGIGVTALSVLATVVALVVGVLAAFALAQPLSGPALEKLVRLQERALGAPERAPTPLLEDMARSLQSVLISYCIGLPILALLFLVSLLVPPAAVVTTPLKLVVTAFMLAWDMCDYPLSVRGLRVGDRLALLGRYWWAVLGYSFALALAALVPCLIFFVLPYGVAGATRLVHAIDRYEQSQGRALGR